MRTKKFELQQKPEQLPMEIYESQHLYPMAVILKQKLKPFI